MAKKKSNLKDTSSELDYFKEEQTIKNPQLKKKDGKEVNHKITGSTTFINNESLMNMDLSDALIVKEMLIRKGICKEGDFRS